MVETVTTATLYRFATNKAACLVSIGESVAAGQQLCATGVFSSINGTVTAIDTQPGLNPGFFKTLTIEIEPNAKEDNSFLQPLHRPLDDQEIIARIQTLGLRGMGGGGFPTHLKLTDAKQNNARRLVINAMECEPGVSVDTDLLKLAAEQVFSGAQFAAQAAGLTEIVLATKSGFDFGAHRDIQHREVDGKYPQGEERRLLHTLFNLDIPATQTPTQQGCLVLNTATCFAIHRAIAHGEPVLQRLTSINGVSSWVKIGHPIGELTANPACGGETTAWSAPVTAGLTATTYALSTKSSKIQTGCIRCSRCREVCPEPLLPDELVWQIKSQNWPLLSSLQLDTCIECGACDLVCPSQIPLLAHLRFGKSVLSGLENKAMAAAQATKHVHAREARILREDRDRELRRVARLKTS